MTPLVVWSPSLSSRTTTTPQTFKKVVNLLNEVKTYILENICQRLEIIEDAWQAIFDLTQFQ